MSHSVCLGCGNNCGNHMNSFFDTGRSETTRKIKCNEQTSAFQCFMCDSSSNDCQFKIVTLTLIFLLKFKIYKQNSKSIFFQEYTEGSSLQGYLMMDYVILGDELMNYYNDNSLLNQTFIQDYIKQEKTKFMFGCTTR